MSETQLTVPVTPAQRERYDSGQPITIAPPVLNEYRVYFKSSDLSRYKEAGQEHVVMAENHFEAVCKSAKRSQHPVGCQYLVVGKSIDGLYTNRTTVRTYVIEPVVDQFGKRHSYKSVHVTAKTTRWIGHYHVTEV